MNTIWVVGNGQSRKHFALNKITEFVIGCNAVHRDHKCDELVAVDQRMVNEILRNDQNLGTVIYTRPDWIDQYKDYSNVCSLPEIPFTGPNKADVGFHWNSGPYAVLLAALKNPKEINLLGFDLYSPTGFVNNLYKDTPNYAASTTRRLSPDFWIYQLGRVFNHFEHIHFIQNQTADWTIPKQWTGIKNLTIKTLSV